MLTGVMSETITFIVLCYPVDVIIMIDSPVHSHSIRLTHAFQLDYQFK